MKRIISKLLRKALCADEVQIIKSGWFIPQVRNRKEEGDYITSTWVALKVILGMKEMYITHTPTFYEVMNTVPPKVLKECMEAIAHIEDCAFDIRPPHPDAICLLEEVADTYKWYQQPFEAVLLENLHK